MESIQIHECCNCGEILGHCGSYCSDWCEKEYNYTNRTCGNCGGEFWDGGTSCTCEEDEEKLDDFEKSFIDPPDYTIDNFIDRDKYGDELPF